QRNYRVVRLERASSYDKFGYRWIANSSSYPIVDHVKRDSTAFEEGLRIYDSIISINGINAFGAKYKEIKTLFERYSLQRQLIVINEGALKKLIDSEDMEEREEKKEEEKEEKKGKEEKEDQKEEKKEEEKEMGEGVDERVFSASADVVDPETQSTCDKNAPRLIRMERDSASGLFGYRSVDDPSFYPIVTVVKEGFPADKAGLKSGDRILEINGTSTYKATYAKMNELFAKPYDQLLVIEDEASEWYEKTIETNYSVSAGQKTERKYRVIRMEKAFSDDKFGYQWFSNRHFYPMVDHVKRNSLAFEAGLRTDDLIISINGINAFKAKSKEIKRMFGLDIIHRQLIVLNEGIFYKLRTAEDKEKRKMDEHVHKEEKDQSDGKEEKRQEENEGKKEMGKGAHECADSSSADLEAETQSMRDE
ncbi:hypothetical protein PFISCL1PPCAC_12171, partial [Pristionchus fissidentatus]